MHATFIHKKNGFSKEDLEHPQSLDEHAEIKLLSTKAYPTQSDAIFDFDNRLNKVKDEQRGRYAILMHNAELCSAAHTVILVLSESKGSFSSITGQNPFYQNAIVPKRSSINNNAAYKLNGTMHSQLLGMLDRSLFDKKLLARYELNDVQQENLYEFQHTTFGQESYMTRMEVVRLIKNTLSFVRLPWIDVYFMKDGNAAFFKLSLTDGTTLDEGNLPDEEQPELALNTPEDDNPTLYAISDTPPEAITIDKLSVHFPESWAMNPQIILHELAHYICFMLGLNVPFYKNRSQLDPDTFTLAFSSHGKLYCTILAELFIKFMYLKREDFYLQMDKFGVCYYKIDRLDERLLYKALKEDFES
jgi:hypothetical protein